MKTQYQHNNLKTKRTCNQDRENADKAISKYKKLTEKVSKHAKKRWNEKTVGIVALSSVM